MMMVTPFRKRDMLNFLAPCVIKSAIITNKQYLVRTSCSNWFHRKCNGTTQTEYDRLSQEPEDLPFHRMLCIMKQNSQLVPLFFLDKSELLELNGIDLPFQLSSSKWLNFTNLGQGLSQKVGFFLDFRPILRGRFFDRILALSNKKATFLLVFGFWLLYFHSFVQILFERSLFTKKAP